MPYSVEEINEQLGSNEMISISNFPREDVAKIHPEANFSELLVQRIIEDSNNILKLMPQKPGKLFIYIAPVWSYDFFEKLIEGRKAEEKTSETLRGFFQSHPTVDKKAVSTMLTRLSKSINELGTEFVDNYQKTKDFNETRVYEDSIIYLGSRLGVEITVEDGKNEPNYDPKKKAVFALPFKPALYFE